MSGQENLQILYEDDHILVVYKEAGVAVQTKNYREKDLESMLRSYRAGKGEEPYIGVVHRLDQPVEGLVLFAKDAQSAAVLSAQINAKETKKQYCAMVEGIPPKKEETLVHYLAHDGKKNHTQAFQKPTDGAKRAELFYRVLKEDEKEQKALLEITLKTGRPHQIRAQLAAIGHPLLGDQKYAGDRKNDEANKSTVKERKTQDVDENVRHASDIQQQLALCAYRLSFRHPVTKKQLSFQIKPQNPAFCTTELDDNENVCDVCSL